MATYFCRWLVAFAVTQAVEVPIYRGVGGLSWTHSFAMSWVTHPIVWYVIAPLCQALHTSELTMFCVAEGMAWSVEAWLAHRLGITWVRAVLVALLANASSVLVGLWLNVG